MTTGATDSALHRQIVETLVGDFERSDVPESEKGVSGRVFACAWGLYAQINRHARAVLTLTDAGMAQESHVLVRVALEHTILLHWVTERGDAGVDAMLNTQARDVHKSIERLRTANLTVPKEVEDAIQQIEPDTPEGEVVGKFWNICNKLNLLDLYFIYGVECAFVHPSIATINAYCNDHSILQKSPQRDIHKGNFAMLAHCLIWAGRDLDRLIGGQSSAEGLEQLAATVGCQPTLPPYSG